MKVSVLPRSHKTSVSVCTVQEAKSHLHLFQGRNLRGWDTKPAQHKNHSLHLACKGRILCVAGQAASPVNSVDLIDVNMCDTWSLWSMSQSSERSCDVQLCKLAKWLHHPMVPPFTRNWVLYSSWQKSSAAHNLSKSSFSENKATSAGSSADSLLCVRHTGGGI